MALRAMALACVLLCAAAAFPPPGGDGEQPAPLPPQEVRPGAGPAGSRAWLRKAVRLVAVAALTLAAACAVLLLFERRLVYHPKGKPVSEWAPAWLGIEEVTFRTRDGLRLYGWWHPGRGEGAPSARPVVLWCHGNAGNITHRADNLALLTQRGLAVLLFDYRGYGRSEGSPSEEGLYLDAEAAYAYLVGERGVEPQRIVVFGRSLGAAPALHVAIERPVAGLIMEGAFASVPAMAKHIVPLLPLGRLVRTKFDNLGRVRRLAVPLLTFHAERDELVPIEQGRAVFDAAPEPKEFHVVEGAGHNDTYEVGGEEYLRTLAEFCRRCVAQAEGRSS
jgi:hypothetical protein